MGESHFSDPELQNIQQLLVQSRNAAARDELLNVASKPLHRLASRIMHSSDRVRRWEGSDDLTQEALIRLHRALETVTPDSVRGFYSLCSRELKRALTDLARKLFGPKGVGAHHHSDENASTSTEPEYQLKSDNEDTLSGCVSDGELWIELLQESDQLPEDEALVFDLLFLQGLDQTAVAELLGVTRRTVFNRYAKARVKLARSLKHWDVDGDLHDER